MRLAPPTNNETWLELLRAADGSLSQDVELAAMLRVLAGAKRSPLCLCSGRSVLPYVDWIRDGMSMTAKLIIHLEPEEAHFQPAIQNQLDTDIRIASHCQAFGRFCSDVSAHRINLLVIDLQRDVTGRIDSAVELLDDAALVIALADEATRDSISEAYSTSFLTAFLGPAILMSRKGIQHKKGRRRGRR